MEEMERHAPPPLRSRSSTNRFDAPCVIWLSLSRSTCQDQLDSRFQIPYKYQICKYVVHRLRGLKTSWFAHLVRTENWGRFSREPTLNTGAFTQACDCGRELGTAG